MRGYIPNRDLSRIDLSERKDTSAKLFVGKKGIGCRSSRLIKREGHNHTSSMLLFLHLELHCFFFKMANASMDIN